jgi:hypothetical protein
MAKTGKALMPEMMPENKVRKLEWLIRVLDHEYVNTNFTGA